MPSILNGAERHVNANKFRVPWWRTSPDYLSSCSSICRRVSVLATYLTGSPEREKRGGGGGGRSRWTSIPNLSISARNLCFRRKFTKNSSPLAATCHWSGVNEGKDMWVRDFLEHSDRNILISAGQVWRINFPVFHSSYINCFHSTCPTWRMTKGFAVVAVIWLLWIVSCHGRKKTEGRMTICFHLLTSGWSPLIRWIDEMKREGGEWMFDCPWIQYHQLCMRLCGFEWIPGESEATDRRGRLSRRK